MSSNPFARKDLVDEPGIVGATWWNKSVGSASSGRTRRGCLIALGTLVILGGAVALIGSRAKSSSGGPSWSEDPDDYAEQRLPSLRVQRELGWRFGAETKSITFESALLPLDAQALASIAVDLQPNDPKLEPYFVRTLLQAPDAQPTNLGKYVGEPTFSPLRDHVRPMRSPPMERAFELGRTLAQAMHAEAEGTRAPTPTPPQGPIAWIVDLPGAVAAAVAAGAAEIFEPVLLCDNWPHPVGVVGSHNLLAALLFHQSSFAAAKKSRPRGAPPLFLLASDRLAAYSDTSDRFDNRYVAKLPDAAGFKTLGIRRVAYLSPDSLPGARAADLSDYFNDWLSHEIEVWILDASLADPWAPRRRMAPPPRVAAYAAGHSNDPNFATTIVMVDKTVGSVAGAKANRNGSWNRAASYGGG
jgi:hypothetical protein